MLSVFMSGASNPAIDRYIPLDEMRETFKKYFGNIIDVDEVIDNYLKKEKDTYDVCEYDDLYKYKKGIIISPSLVKPIEKSFRFYCDVTNNEEYETEKMKSSEEIFHFLASKFRSHGLFFLHEEHWEKIYDELKRDKKCFYRYYPITRVKVNQSLEHLVRAFVTNDDFWNYCCEFFSEEK